jgi:hypothetical protein
VWVIRDGPAILRVAIDVKPGTGTNAINLRSEGTVPVAILGTATFRAATVDPSTVTLAGAAVQRKPNGALMASLEDVDHDGRPDLVVHVGTRALRLTAASTEAVLRGRTFDGAEIEGRDAVRIVR